MIWLVRRLRRDFAAWDRLIQIAFVIGIVLLVVALIAVIAAPPDQRLTALLGVVGLLIVLEITVLWGNRGMVSAYTQAQRLYLDGQLAEARDLLESVRAKADARTLTLLGNTYRQLGQLAESEAVLSEAVDKAPNHYFSLYGFGRTLLAEGRFTEAAEMIRRALDAGAPPSVRADLGEAYYRMNRTDEAAEALRGAANEEPPRALMIAYLRYRMGEAPPPALELIRAGLPYWQATAERFQHTPYGEALMRDLDELLKQGK